MTKPNGTIYSKFDHLDMVECDCGSEYVSLCKFDDEDQIYLSLVSVHYSYSNSIWNRIKLAFRIIFGHKLYLDTIVLKKDHLTGMRDLINKYLALIDGWKGCKASEFSKDICCYAPYVPLYVSNSRSHTGDLSMCSDKTNEIMSELKLECERNRREIVNNVLIGRRIILRNDPHPGQNSDWVVLKVDSEGIDLGFMDKDGKTDFFKKIGFMEFNEKFVRVIDPDEKYPWT